MHVSGLEEVAALESLSSFQPTPLSGDHPPSSAPHRSATSPQSLLTLLPSYYPYAANESDACALASNVMPADC